MKTERFDDEFRRKLLGLPADTGPGEVERIQAYVQTYGPNAPGFGWRKLMLVGGAGLLLVASLTFNVIESYRNTQLQASLNALGPRSRPLTNYIQHDTVYLVRQATEPAKRRDSPLAVAAQPSGHEPAEHALAEPFGRNSAPAVSTWGRVDSPVDGLPQQPARTGQRDESLTKTNSSRLAAKSVLELPASDQMSFPRVPKEVKARWYMPNNHSTDPSASATTNVTSRPTKFVPGPVKSPLLRASTELAGQRPAPWSVSATGLPNDKRNERALAIREPIGRLDAHGNSPGSTPASAEGTITAAPVAQPNRQAILLEPLHLRPLTIVSTVSPRVSSQRLLTPSSRLPMTPNMPQRWQLSLPTLSVPKAQFRLGVGGVAGGDDQLGGSLLGEVLINRHWGLQAGLRVLSSPGFHYGNEQDFDEHQPVDFRQTYAAQIPLTSTIMDIQQESVIVQVPIQIGYHYGLSQQWGLRLGVGTDLDLWGHSAISYQYQTISRLSEGGLTWLNTPVRVFNNLTIIPAVEWCPAKWVVRAGPFINPQLRPVSYKPEDLSWGATLQVLYRLSP